MMRRPRPTRAVESWQKKYLHGNRRVLAVLLWAKHKYRKAVTLEQ
jgi:hypothetical protein